MSCKFLNFIKGPYDFDTTLKRIFCTQFDSLGDKATSNFADKNILFDSCKLLKLSALHLFGQS